MRGKTLRAEQRRVQSRFEKLMVSFVQVCALSCALLMNPSTLHFNSAHADQAQPSAALPVSTTAGHQIGFVEIAKGRQLYVDYLPPAPGRPTMVLLNGLTYRIGSWDAFVKGFQNSGIGILQFDPMGMGQTLLKYAPATAPFELKDQLDDIDLLLAKLKITQPIHVVGLSYGGAMGMAYAIRHPDRIASLTLMAPFVAPLGNQDQMIRLQIQQTRLLFPSNPASFDELYDYFLRITIYSTYPSVEPIVLENPYKLEATFRLVQGIRKFLARDIASQLPVGKVHLMVARQDQYIDNAIHDEFWSQVPEASRASRIYINGSEHKIPEYVPKFSAAWVKRIVEGDPLISGDRTFEGYPIVGTVVWGTTHLDLGTGLGR